MRDDDADELLRRVLAETGRRWSSGTRRVPG